MVRPKTTATLHEGLVKAASGYPEKLSNFITLHEDMKADLLPQGKQEELLVEQLVVYHWRLRRAYLWEENLIHKKYNSLLEKGSSQHQAKASSMPGRERMYQIIRYEQHLNSCISNALKELKILQTTRLQKSKNNA